MKGETMNNLISVPEGLNKKQQDMYRTLMRCKENNITRKWNYNPTHVLVGTKKTNPMNGETKITFSTEKREPLKEEAKKEGEIPVAITEEILKQKIEELTRLIQMMNARKEAWEALLLEHFGQG